MTQSINLIPQEEVVQQRKTRWVKMSTVIAVVLLVVLLGASGYIIYLSNSLKSQVKDKEDSISGLRSQILSLADIEISARNLDQKHQVISSFLNGKSYYSKMLSEIAAQTPSSVVVDTFTFGRENSINLSGTGETYLAINEFINNLVQTDLFTEVTINSVSLENSTSSAKFFIVADYSEEELKQ